MTTKDYGMITSEAELDALATEFEKDLSKPIGFDRHVRRFFSKFEIRSVPTEWQDEGEPNGPCWIWKSARYGNGYAMFTVGNKKAVLAHRWIYQKIHGEFPFNPCRKFVIHHKCNVRWCVAPHHLKLVTQAMNLLASPATCPNKTHCKFGHELTDENVYLKPATDNKGPKRDCLICRRERDKARSRNPKRALDIREANKRSRAARRLIS